MIWFRPESELDERLQDVAKCITDGGIVVLPTETVYGLACSIDASDAVQAIRELKGRDDQSPFSVMISDPAQASELAGDWTEAAAKLAEAYWPGPLTIVVDMGARVSDAVTAGKSTVGIRVPQSAITLAVLRMSGVPVVGTSVNKTSEAPATTAKDAVAVTGDVPSYIVDAGPCEFGLASTVVALTEDSCKVIREGTISQSDLETTLGG